LFSLETVAHAVNRAVELHDSELASVTLVDTSAVLSFSHAYVHESIGQPGVDVGSGWYQPANFVVTHATVAPLVQLPASVSGGSLRAAGRLHENVIPLAASLAGPIDLSLALSAGDILVVHGDTLSIELHGERSAVENFSP
jgi:hypothetical protein